MRIRVEPQNQIPEFDDNLKRINVFLGTNGTGKSKLLQALAGQLARQEEYRVVPVIGTRGVGPIQVVNAVSTEGKDFDDFDLETRDSFGGKGQTAQSRLMEALQLFSNNLASERVAYRKRHLAWMADPAGNAQPAELVERDVDDHISELLSLFTEIFPQITITATNANYSESLTIKGLEDVKQGARRIGQKLDFAKFKDAEVRGQYKFQLTCKKDGANYPPQSLSDGEKQILSLLSDRFFWRDKKCLFIIDEPELNLDPVLATRYWTLMEREMDESIFIYATHSLDFALRPNVEQAWILDGKKANKLESRPLHHLAYNDQRTFLSGIRGILTTNTGLVVEGNEESFDAEFYPWVLNTNPESITIRGYGGCNDVEDATKKLDLWNEIAPMARVIGIIDADYRTDEELSELDDTCCLPLSLHDAESYICHPDLLRKLADELKAQGFPEREALIDQIIEYLEATKVNICRNRLARQCRFVRHLPIRNQDEIPTTEELKVKAKGLAAALNATKVDFDTDQIINNENRRCVTAKSNRDLNELLRLVKGKDLLPSFATLLGLADGIAVMKFVRQHLSADDFQHTRDLRDSINAKLR